MSKYQIFVVDPPWKKKKGGRRKARPNQGRDLDYPTMSTSQIFELLDKDIFILADTNHCVFMWTIEEFLTECEEQMANRGYRRHCRMIWDKTNGVAPAFTVRFSHEYLIWYYKEKLMPIAQSQRGKFKTVFQEKAREHSRKPEIAYQMIDSLYPDTTKIDVFSREKRNNWEQYGDQLNRYAGSFCEKG